METIRKMNAPEIAEEMRSLLGFSDYVFRMIPHFATITEHRRRCTKNVTCIHVQNVVLCMFPDLLNQFSKTCRLLNIYVSAESSIYFNKEIRPNNDHCGIKHNF